MWIPLQCLKIATPYLDLQGPDLRSLVGSDEDIGQYDSNLAV